MTGRRSITSKECFVNEIQHFVWEAPYLTQLLRSVAFLVVEKFEKINCVEIHQSVGYFSTYLVLVIWSLDV